MMPKSVPKESGGCGSDSGTTQGHGHVYSGPYGRLAVDLGHCRGGSFVYLDFPAYGEKIQSHQGEVQKEAAELTHFIGEGVGGHKIIKAFNLQKYGLGRFKKPRKNCFSHYASEFCRRGCPTLWWKLWEC